MPDNSTTYPRYPLCPLCEREVWPLMDKAQMPNGAIAHAYCWLKQRSIKERQRRKEQP